MTDFAELVERYWGIRPDRVTPLGGGMNSETWLVQSDETAYVVKQVQPDDLGMLVAGCHAASSLADSGIVTGRPVPACDGRIVVVEHALALLERVSGLELEGDTDEEQRWIASTLARVHVAGGPRTETARFAEDWLSPRGTGVEDHPWLLPAIAAVRAETDGLPLTWSLLHTDPTPEAFRHDANTGVTGLIDWAGARRGPVLYDVASAVMYLGGPDHAAAFLAAYEKVGPLSVEELTRLDAFRRFRWAVQGVYFARRLADRDLTGLHDQSGNQKGIDDARRGLSALGIDTHMPSS